MKQIFAALILIMSAAVWAGDYEDGRAAYEKGDYATAVAKFETAAAQGLVDAQFNLGFMYSNGQGVQQNYAQAIRWYRLAAAQGDAAAQWHSPKVVDAFLNAVRRFRVGNYFSSLVSLGLTKLTK